MTSTSSQSEAYTSCSCSAAVAALAALVPLVRDRILASMTLECGRVPDVEESSIYAARNWYILHRMPQKTHSALKREVAQRLQVHPEWEW